jgi:catechol 2,3-dioxygenase-like lactoylglutathione lyase family enzyme
MGLLGWPTWIGVVVEDLERQRRFWGELLGLQEAASAGLRALRPARRAILELI